MRITSIELLNQNQKKQIFELWNKEYPKTLKLAKIEALEDYLAKLQDKSHILLLDETNKIKGWYFDFIREEERWFAMIIDSELQGKGYGTRFLNLAKQERVELNGWLIKSGKYKKANDQPYRAPTEFYIKNGFKVFEDIKLITDKICAFKIKWTKTESGSI